MITRTMLTAAVLIGLLGPSTAFAQEPERTRQGFWFSGGLGWGTADCEACVNDRVGGAAAVLALGGTLSQKLLLGASLNGWFKQEGDVTLALGATTAALRFYPARNAGLFLLGGLGVSSRAIKTDVGNVSVTVSDNGTAALLGAGYDLRVARNLSLTPFANVIGVDFDGQGTGFTQVGLSLTVH